MDKNNKKKASQSLKFKQQQSQLHIPKVYILISSLFDNPCIFIKWFGLEGTFKDHPGQTSLHLLFSPSLLCSFPG